MSRKRYEVKGMMEWHPVFRVGRMRLNVSFTGGHLCGGATTPASYETSDPVVQAVIESSDAFKSRRITARVLDRYPQEPVSLKREKKEFADLGKAQDYLQLAKGLAIELLSGPEECVAEAGKLGIDLIIKG